MTSKVFYCSKQRAMHLAQEVLRDMKLRKESIDQGTSIIHARRSWGFFAPAKEVEVQVFADDHRVEVAVTVASQPKMLDFGTDEYLEEEFLHRLKERLN